MKLPLVIILASVAFAASPERTLAMSQAKQNAKRLAEYQRITAKIGAAQAEQAALLAEWAGACAPKVPRADGGCQDAPAPQKPVTPKAPAAPPAE